MGRAWRILFERYGRSFPELAKFRASVVASVNQEFAEWRAPLASGDEVAFLPPVSGGAIPAGAAVEEDLCALVRRHDRDIRYCGATQGPARWRRGRV